MITPDGILHQDNDDDGESAAGGRLAHLLMLMEVCGVVVVVSRWFGGVHLGADRFKHINQVRCVRTGGVGNADTWNRLRGMLWSEEDFCRRL